LIRGEKRLGQLILNATLNGILLGGVLALLVFGLNLIFGVVKIIHLAYGQFVMVGMYIIFLLMTTWKMNIFIASLISCFSLGMLGIILQLIVINPLLKSPRLNQLLALAGLIIIFENMAMVLWGADYRGIKLFLPVIHIGSLFVRTSYLVAFIGAIITLIGLNLFLNKTYVGIAIRATAQDLDSTQLMGINPKWVYLITQATGGILSGIVASFFMPIYTVHPHFGSDFTLMAFIIVILGGMGNFLGGFISAFIIGVVTSISAVLTSTEISESIALSIFILIMLVRPQGLLGIRESR
jgi:branched-chain amino acid transport system permease protein